MTWPAPALPINYTNATQQQDIHPTAHNATNQSLNDNYRPEITRIGDSLADTQSVYNGLDPNGIAAVEAGSVRMRIASGSRVQRYDKLIPADVLGQIPYLNLTGGFQNGADNTPGSTTGATPVDAYRMTLVTQNNKGWPAGGIVTVTAFGFLQLDTAPSDGTVRAGIRIGGVTTYPTTNSGARARVTTDQPRVQLNSTWTFDIPPGTPGNAVDAVVGVANIQGSALSVVSTALAVVSWAY